MFGFLGSIVASLFSSGLSSVTASLQQAYATKLAAANDAERLKADIAIRTLEAQQAVLVAEATSGGLQSWIRPLFALPFVIYNAKLVVWDKVLGFGSTDSLSPELVQIELLVIGSYFAGRTIERVVRTVKA